MFFAAIRSPPFPFVRKFAVRESTERPRNVRPEVHPDAHAAVRENIRPAVRPKVSNDVQPKVREDVLPIVASKCSS